MGGGDPCCALLLNYAKLDKGGSGHDYWSGVQCQKCGTAHPRLHIRAEADCHTNVFPKQLVVKSEYTVTHDPSKR